MGTLFADEPYIFGRNIALNRQNAELQQRNQSLQKRLKHKEEVEMLDGIRKESLNMLLDMALEALKAANPDSPLLDKNNRDAVRKKFMTAELDKKGYSYNLATNQIQWKYSD